MRYIKTRCHSCTNSYCTKKPIGSWVTETEGCIKHVTELDGNKFFHYVSEVKPMLMRAGKIGNDVAAWREMVEFIEYIHNKAPGEYFKRG